jgi:signal recognition particle subunit SEC65
VAAYPPKKKGQSVSSAQVYWPLIDELRDALDELGIEWRPARWDRVR